MEKAYVRVKKWGNSYEVILPSKIIKEQNIIEGTELEILINQKNKTKVKDIFGILKGKLKRDTDDLLKEVNRDFEKICS
ncbi:hypothetical protein J4221_07125 [Candidatus Pacearchaeota archaeon]|nr:hypothetical protein [Candidatus Pacearchaeota archaeon]